jgi:hypothetical protein
MGRPQVSPDDAVLDVGHHGRFDEAQLFELEVADAVEQPPAGADQERNGVELELIDVSRGEISLDDAGASAQQHILAVRDLTSALDDRRARVDRASLLAGVLAPRLEF